MLEHLELGTPGDGRVAGVGSREDQVLSFQALPSETPRQDVSKAGNPTSDFACAGPGCLGRWPASRCKWLASSENRPSLTH